MLDDEIKRLLLQILDKVNRLSPPEGPPAMDAEEAARFLGIKIHTFYALGRRGKVPGYQKVGGKIVVNRRQFVQWFETGGRR